jgi:hypothetical protein
VEQNHTAAFELLLKGAQMNNSDCYQVSEGVMCGGVMCEGVMFEGVMFEGVH